MIPVDVGVNFCFTLNCDSRYNSKINSWYQILLKIRNWAKGLSLIGVLIDLWFSKYIKKQNKKKNSKHWHWLLTGLLYNMKKERC